MSLWFPQQLHSDQGSNLNAEVNQKLCHLLGIERTRTTAYHPQGNGKWNDLIVQLKQCLQKWLESIIVIGTSIYRKRFLHMGHHCMSLQGTHVSSFISVPVARTVCIRTSVYKRFV